MTEAQPTDAMNTLAVRGWSTRTLLAALAGILFLTLYPFEFSLHTSLVPGRSPFFLGNADKGGGTLDVALNILLFMPFGFALAAELRRKVKSWPLVLLYSWIAGALLSYTIEFLQLYIPARDSGWEDVFSNSTGSALGCVLFLIIGQTVFRALGKTERAIQTCLPVRSAFLLAALLFVGWSLYSIHLQKQSHFDTWNSDAYLVFGNDASGRRPWKGKIVRVEIWDRAVDSSSAGKLTADAVADATDSHAPIARFDFSSLPPREDGAALRIPLSSALLRDSSGPQNAFDSAPLVASSRPVSDLTADLQKTNQFSIHLIFVPEGMTGFSGRIISISPPSGIPSLFVGQENSDLFFWFRNRLSVKRPALAWEISRLLPPDRERNLLFSFDGADLRLYADGHELQRRYWGPGTALASLVHHARQGELNGYRDIFCAAVFLPIGCLFGVAARNPARSSVVVLFTIGGGLLLMPLILEFELSAFDGRPFSTPDFALSVLMLLAGIFWINADRPEQPPTPQAHPLR